MSKELSPLEAWQVIKETLTRYNDLDLVKSVDNLEELKIIKTALDQKAKQDEVLELLFKWFEPQIISEIGKLPRLQIKCGTFTFSYEFENEYDWRLVKDLIAQRKKTK